MNPDPSVAVPSREPLASVVEIERAIDRVLALAGRRIAIFDRSLDSRWDRGERIEVLRRFCLASPRNSLRIALHDPESLVRRTPRLRGMLETFGHVIAIHRTRDDAAMADDPLVLVDDHHFVHRFHVDQPRAVLVLDDPAATRPLMERFEQIWGASDPGLSGTTLGL